MLTAATQPLEIASRVLQIRTITAVRWYSQSQALACFEAAGFTDLTITAADTFTPATAEDTLFKITAIRVAPSAEYVESPIARS